MFQKRSKPRVAPRCIVCDEPTVTRPGTMCGDCGEAYDRFNRRSDGTTHDLIQWAASRALRKERMRRKNQGAHVMQRKRR